MSVGRQGAKRGRQTASLTQVRQMLGEGLRAKSPEIEQELLAAVGALEQDRDVDPEYALGLRDSVPIALEYGIKGIESSERGAPPVPTQLYGQARLAARNGVKLSTVLSRYISGYNLLQAFADEIAEAEEIVSTSALREVRRVGQLALERLTATVSEQHEEESSRWASSPEWRMAVLVRKLLDGERVDTSQLNYDLDGYHVGLVVNGASAATAIKGLAQALDCIPLIIDIPDGQTWAWLGRQTPPKISHIGKLVGTRWPADSLLTLGEVDFQLAGWRRTHRQALAAVSAAQRIATRVVRYRDVALLASALNDDLLGDHLQTMLKPLDESRIGGRTLRDTIRAFLETERSISSTAALLNINRRTVTSRLRTAEKLLGSPLSTISADLEVALRLDAANIELHKM